ncbi:MAG: hypothetical protein V4674_01900 [Patescibacteria group bacterium]
MHLKAIRGGLSVSEKDLRVEEADMLAMAFDIVSFIRHMREEGSEQELYRALALKTLRRFNYGSRRGIPLYFAMRVRHAMLEYETDHDLRKARREK